VVEAALQGVRPIADRRGMHIELRMQAKQPLAAFSTEGITHVLENLLFNAVKYGDASEPIVVEVKRLPGEPVAQLEVRVINRGKGLLPAELKQVFERFFRASNADGQKGVGLGLSVVKRIIEAHHGTVWAESEGGVTTFAFRIPQRYESSVSELPKPARREARV
jgi:signal transduction histidine kinase